MDKVEFRLFFTTKRERELVKALAAIKGKGMNEFIIGVLQNEIKKNRALCPSN